MFQDLFMEFFVGKLKMAENGKGKGSGFPILEFIDFSRILDRYTKPTTY